MLGHGAVGAFRLADERINTTRVSDECGRTSMCNIDSAQ